jgi:hypothetical protein
MTTIIAVHEVESGDRWARAWQKGPRSRHELVAKIGVKARTFRDPQNPNLAGLIFEVPDMAKFQSFMQSDEAKKAMAEDGVKPETLRILGESTS